MNAKPLEELWLASANRPEADAGQRLAAHFVGRTRRQRRFQAAWLVWTFLALTTVSIMVVTQLKQGGRGGLDGQWAVFPLLAAPWGVALHFLRSFRREGAAPREAGLPVRAAFAAVSAANQSERRRLLVVGWLLAATAPTSALAIWQLHVAGKAPSNQAWSMAAVFGGAIAFGAAGVWLRHRRVAAEQHRIEARLREFEVSAAG